MVKIFVMEVLINWYMKIIQFFDNLYIYIIKK